MNCPIDYARAYVALPLKLVCAPILPNNQSRIVDKFVDEYFRVNADAC